MSPHTGTRNAQTHEIAQPQLIPTVANRPE